MYTNSGRRRSRIKAQPTNRLTTDSDNQRTAYYPYNFHPLTEKTDHSIDSDSIAYAQEEIEMENVQETMCI